VGIQDQIQQKVQKDSSVGIQDQIQQKDNVLQEQGLHLGEIEEKSYGQFLKELVQLYEQDEFFAPIWKDLSDGTDRRDLERAHPHFVYRNQLLWLKLEGDVPERLCVPSSAQKFKLWILEQCHDVPFAGHLGEQRTLEKVRRYYFWKNMRQQIRKYCSECFTCQQNKILTRNNRLPLRQIPIPERRMQQVSMDFVTNLPQSENGNTCIWVAIDYLTKYCILEPIHHTLTAQEFGKLFHNRFFRYFGVPEVLISDNDKLFTSDFWKSLAKQLGVKHIFSTRGHPETDGQTERFNRTMLQMIRAFVNYEQSNWETMLANIQFAYNDSINSVTGITPFKLMYGMDPRSPTLGSVKSNHKEAREFAEAIQNTVDMARETILLNKYAAEAAYIRKYSIEPHALLKAGDMVWVRSNHFIPDTMRQQQSRKLLPRYIGPFPIKKVLNSHVYEIDFPQNIKIDNRINRRHLKAYREPNLKTLPNPPPAVEIEGESEYEVESVLDTKVKHGKRYYLVRWKGYGIKEDSWEPEEYLRNAPEKIAVFQSRKNLAETEGDV
jgi:hypothetical protein